MKRVHSKNSLVTCELLLYMTTLASALDAGLLIQNWMFAKVNETQSRVEATVMMWGPGPPFPALAAG